MKIKDFYLNAYPDDEYAKNINANATFADLYSTLVVGNCVYEFLGVCDSLIRENCFAKLSEMMDEPYDTIYKLWLSKDSNEQILKDLLSWAKVNDQQFVMDKVTKLKINLNL